MRKSYGLVGGALFGIAGAALAVGMLLPAPGARSQPAAEDVARQFCSPIAVEAQVTAVQAATVAGLVVQVPAQAAPHHANVPGVTVGQGDIVKFEVRSDVQGAAGVHGLSQIDVVGPGQPLTVAFRAAFTGRFPIHFHGVDGSHFAIANVDVAEVSGNGQP